jgi:hypothetical protein
MAQIPLSVSTLYSELAELAMQADGDEATVLRKVERGITYLRLQRWVGASRVVEHLGRADDPEVQARAEAAKAGMGRRTQRRDLVSLLRKALPGPQPQLGKILDAVASAGLFRKGVVLVGTAAYQCYPPLVGSILPAQSAMTQDADLATADLAISGDVEGATLETILRRADPTFSGVPELDPRAFPSRFRNAAGFRVDVLTPRRRKDDSHPMPMRNLRAGAAPLQHLDWLIADAREAVVLHGAGVRVTVPRPERYAVHKLIIAQKREDAQREKRRKDLLQAGALMAALEAQAPYDLEDALREAIAKGKTGWAEPIRRSLKEIGRDLSEFT